MKINKLEIENVKRIKAVKIEPTKDGLRSGFHCMGSRRRTLPAVTGTEGRIRDPSEFEDCNG